MALPSYSRGYTPKAAGAQMPSRYPFTGKNYAIWGEQAGFIYDPYTDLYRADPKKKQEYYEGTGLVEKAKENPGLAEQVLPIAAVAGSTALAQEGGKALVQGLSGALGLGGDTATRGLVSTAAQNSGLSSFGTPGAGLEQFGSEMGASGQFQQGINSLGSSGSSGSGLSGLIGDGGTFYNTSGIYNSGGMFGASPDGWSMGNLGVGNYLGAAAGAYGVYNAAQSGDKTTGVTQGALSGAMAGGSIVPGWGHLIGAVVGGLLGLTAHETTSDRTKRRYQELDKTENAAFEAMKKKGMEWSLSGQDTWDIGDDKAQAPVEGMINSYGVLKTFGPEWAALSPEQQSQIVKEMVNQDLINSKQGEYLVDNPDAAKKIYADVLAKTGGIKAPQQQGGQTAAQGQAAGASAPYNPNQTFTFQGGPTVDRYGKPVPTPNEPAQSAPIAGSPMPPTTAPLPPAPYGQAQALPPVPYGQPPQQPGGLLNSGQVYNRGPLQMPGLQSGQAPLGYPWGNYNPYFMKV